MNVDVTEKEVLPRSGKSNEVESVRTEKTGGVDWNTPRKKRDDGI